MERFGRLHYRATQYEVVMSKKNIDLDPHQEKMLRDLIVKEMMKKIQSRVESEDSHVLKSIKSLINEQEDKKQKIEKKLKNILKEKKENDTDEE